MNFTKTTAARLGLVAAVTLGLFSLQDCKMNKKDTLTINTSDMDSSVNPGVDFFDYANGKWIKNNPIPASERAWGSFNELDNKNKVILHKILDEAAANTSAPKGSNTQKIGDYYFSGMDSASIEKQGIAPLKDEFAKIDAISDKNSLIIALTHSTRIGAGSLFSFYVEPDDKISTQYAAKLSQSGLSLPGKEYYLNPDDRNKGIREKYVLYVSKVFTLMGDDQAKADANAKTVMTIETALATSSMGRVEMRDPHAIYHKMTVEEFAKTTPNIDWPLYIKNIGIDPSVKDVIVAQPDFFVALNKLLESTSIDDWKTYMRWHLINSMATALSSNFEEAHFDFYGKVLSGVKTQQPRWKRILQSTDGNLGEILGQEYVKVAFPPEAKEKALAMVKNLQAELKDRIEALTWMSPETKTKALEKLSTMMIKIGYPDKWRDYSKLDIDRGPFVLNEMRASEFAYQFDLDKFGKPIDRTEWDMTPPTINAYYNPVMNEIVFPAGILQFPFFDANADDALNYGGIGAVIGHEMTHGFDDEGCQYDAQGNLKNWWTKEDSINYSKRTELVVQQFNEYVPLDTIHINGKLTLGENIADLGGITVAYYAYEKFLDGKKREMIDGFTPEQRFFIAFAQLWKGQMRPEALASQLLTNPHSPGKYRVLGALSNLPEFQKAFNLPDNAAMVRPADKRARIW